MKLLIVLAAAVAGYCYYRGLAARRLARPGADLSRWEGEGGNVPSAAKASPTRYIPAGDPAVRH